jgi:hypothetical protein
MFIDVVTGLFILLILHLATYLIRLMILHQPVSITGCQFSYWWGSLIDSIAVITSAHQHYCQNSCQFSYCWGSLIDSIAVITSWLPV